MNLMALLRAAKTGIQGAAWWARFEAWRAERNERRRKEVEDARRAAKMGLVLLAAFLAYGASCKTTLVDLAEYCRERPWECGGTPQPRVTVAPSATVPAATPTPTPTATRTPETAVPVVGTCQEIGDHPGLKPALGDQVQAAEESWLAANGPISATKPDGKWVYHGIQRNVLPAYRDYYYFEIANLLRSAGLDAVVAANADMKPSGELAVSARGDTTMHEQWSVLVSSGDIRGLDKGAFRAVCRPRGFDGGGAMAPSPPPAPTAATTYVPPRMDFWRGCGDANMTREVAGDGRAKRFCDTTIWWQCPMVPSSVGGARSCDPDHAIAFSDCCSGRRADDPRGPIFRVTTTAGGPVEVRQPCRNGNHFNACFLAPAGTVATIDTCPRPGAYTCVNPHELANIDTGIKYDPADPATDCPSGKVPLVIGGRGCYGAEEVRF